jgi:HB1, ASXL, restriction endonuclease HTH domain
MDKSNISFADAAYKILSASKTAMRPKEIADIIIKKGLLKTGSARPDATLSARIRRDKRFVKKGRGLWTVR